MEAFCTVCGEAFDEEERFCSRCGRERRHLPADEMICKECGAEVDEDAVFCSECGAEVSHDRAYCTACGDVISGDEQYCPSCGEHVTASSGVQRWRERTISLTDKISGLVRLDRTENIVFATIALLWLEGMVYMGTRTVFTCVGRCQPLVVENTAFTIAITVAGVLVAYLCSIVIVAVWRRVLGVLFR